MTIKCNANLYRLAASCASTESTRYYLNGVFVEPHPCGGVTLTATDGHRLICFYDADGSADAPAIVRLSKEALRSCKPKKAGGRFGGELRTVEASATTATISAMPTNRTGMACGPAAVVATSPEPFIDGTFPDWRRVLPNVEAAGEPGAFNPAYVASFADIAADLGAMVRAVGTDAGAPALIQFDGCNIAFGVLMPVRRGDASNGLPTFYSARPFERPAVTIGAFLNLGNYGDAPPPYSFAVTSQRSALHSADVRTFKFANRTKAARAFNRVLAGLQTRDQCLEVETIRAECQIPAEHLAERRRRVRAIDDATAAFAAADATDLAAPWRRAILPVPQFAGDLQNAIACLPHVSEARALATAYGAPAPQPTASRGRSRRRAA